MQQIIVLVAMAYFCNTKNIRSIEKIWYDFETSVKATLHVLIYSLSYSYCCYDFYLSVEYLW